MTHHKSIHRAAVKSFGEDDGLEEGQFLAYAAVFDTKDSDGDVIRKGAFTETLSDWSESEAPIPVLWGHDFADMHNNIGHVVEASEDDTGLLVKAQLDLEHPNGAQAHRLISQRRVTDLSFAFNVRERKLVEEDDEPYVELLKLDVFEVSVVPIGANRETHFVGVKTAARKVAGSAGRLQSAKTDEEVQSGIKSLADHLVDLGESLRESGQDQDLPDESGDEDHGGDDAAEGEAEEPRTHDHEARDTTDADADPEAGDGKGQGSEVKMSPAEWRRMELQLLKMKGAE